VDPNERKDARGWRWMEEGEEEVMEDGGDEESAIILES
jgi:hypothetical protein